MTNNTKHGSVWSREKIAKLISLYKMNECLWNTCLETYKCRDHRSKAFKAIRTELNISKDHLGRKIHNLRNQFNAEMKKINKRSGNAKSEHKCHWEYYDSLLFLKDYIAPRPVPGFMMTASFHANNNSNTATSSFGVDNKYEVDSDTTTSTHTHNQEVLEEVPIDQEQIECVEIMSKEELQDMANDNEQINCKTPLPIEHHYIQTPVTKHSDIIRIERSSIDEQKNLGDSYSVNIRKSAKRKISIEDARNDRDEWDIFGDFVAAELRDLNSRDSKKKLRRKIMEVIIEVGKEDDQI